MSSYISNSGLRQENDVIIKGIISETFSISKTPDPSVLGLDEIHAEGRI